MGRHGLHSRRVKSTRTKGPLKEIYPTYSGTGRLTEYPTEGRQAHPALTPASELEPRAIKCAQCGQPIEDYADISNCPFCDSDNFLGEKYPLY